jgi:transcription elongation GreA/GreB family factor
MTKEIKIEYLRHLIREKMATRERLMEEFEDAPSAMESQHDHTRQDIATEVSVVDHAIHDLREVIYHLEHLEPDSKEIVQVGHTVELKMGGFSETFLLLEGLGGIKMGDVDTLSTGTPIGKAILGKRVGATVKTTVPGGTLHIQILSVE